MRILTKSLNKSGQLTVRVLLACTLVFLDLLQIKYINSYLFLNDKKINDNNFYSGTNITDSRVVFFIRFLYITLTYKEYGLCVSFIYYTDTYMYIFFIY